MYVGPHGKLSDKVVERLNVAASEQNDASSVFQLSQHYTAIQEWDQFNHWTKQVAESSNLKWLAHLG